MLKILLSLSLLSSTAFAADDRAEVPVAAPSAQASMRVTPYKKTIELIAAEDHFETVWQHVETMRQVDRNDNINLQYEAIIPKIQKNLDVLKQIADIVTKMNVLSIKSNNDSVGNAERSILDSSYQRKFKTINTLLESINKEPEYKIYGDPSTQKEIDCIKINSLDFIKNSFEGTSIRTSELSFTAHCGIDKVTNKISLEMVILEGTIEGITTLLAAKRHEFIDLQETTKISLAQQVGYLNSLSKTFLS